MDEEWKKSMGAELREVVYLEPRAYLEQPPESDEPLGGTCND